MKRLPAIVLGAAIAAAASCAWIAHHHHGKLIGSTMSQHRSEFTFTVHAPLTEAFPLFGPEGERPWAGSDWDPQFVAPMPAKDMEGAVFRIRHAHHHAVWMNTAFDASTGHAAYAYFIADKLVTRINVQLTPIGADSTSVRVMYERTALDPSLESDVADMSTKDAQMGPEWETAIANYLQAGKSQTRKH